MIRSRDRSASSSRILAAVSCGLFVASPVFAQQGLSDWQSTPSASTPDSNWSSTPPGSYLQQGKTSAKKSTSSGKATSAPPLRTDDFSSDFSSKGQGLSGWQGSSSGGGSNSSGGSQGLSGWQGSSSSGGSASSGGSQGLSGWQGSSSGGGSNSSGGSQGLSGWQSGGSSSGDFGSGSNGGSQGLSGWQSGGGGGSNATLGDVLQQEQNMEGANSQLQGGVERNRTVNGGGAMGGGMADMNGMAGAPANGMGGSMSNQLGGGMGAPVGGLNGMAGNPMGGMGGALGGMGGAGGLMDVLMNIMPKPRTPGATTSVGGGANQSYFRTKSHGPNMLTGVPRTVNRSVNRALNRNLNRGINTAAARATNSALRRLRF